EGRKVEAGAGRWRSILERPEQCEAGRPEPRKPQEAQPRPRRSGDNGRDQGAISSAVGPDVYARAEGEGRRDGERPRDATPDTVPAGRRFEPHLRGRGREEVGADRPGDRTVLRAAPGARPEGRAPEGRGRSQARARGRGLRGAGERVFGRPRQQG